MISSPFIKKTLIGLLFLNTLCFGATPPVGDIFINKNWSEKCQALKEKLSQEIDKNVFADVAFSRWEGNTSSKSGFWSIELNGIIVPIPKIDFKIKVSKPIKDAASLIYLANKEKQFAISIEMIGADKLDFYKALAKEQRLPENFDVFSLKYHLPYGFYKAKIDQNTYRLKDINCGSMEDSLRPLMAVVGKSETDKKLKYREPENAAVFHLNAPDAILKIRKVYKEDFEKKIWIAELLFEKNGLLTEVTYFSNDLRPFIKNLPGIWPLTVTSGDTPKEILDDVRDLKTSLTKTFESVR